MSTHARMSPTHMRAAMAAVSVVSAAGLLAAPVRAAWRDMESRLPAQTNAVVAINIEAVMRSPLAVKEQWAQDWEGNFQTGPVAVIPGTQRVLAAAFVKPGLQDSDWRITMMELKEPVAIEDVARSQGGYTETIQAGKAVHAPEAYFLNLDEKTLASFAPADRQSLYRWLVDKMGRGIESPHLQGLVRGLGTSTHILMAIDLQEQYSPETVRYSLTMNPLSKLDSAKTDVDRLAEVLAGIQYVVLKVDVTDKLQATAILQMSTGAEWFAELARPVAAEALSRAGIGLPEIENWTVEAGENRVTMAGEMSKASLFDLLSILGMATARKPVEISDDPAVIGQTSREFYRAICTCLDSYPKAGNYEQVKRWIQRETQKMEHLPLVNVDPDLVAWSIEITRRMREVTLMLAADNQSATAAMLGVQNPEVVGGYAGDYRSYDRRGRYSSSDRIATLKQNKLAQENAARQRMQTLRQRQAESLKAIGVMMGDLSTGRNEIRARMTARYKTPF